MKETGQPSLRTGPQPSQVSNEAADLAEAVAFPVGGLAMGRSQSQRAVAGHHLEKESNHLNPATWGSEDREQL